MVAESPQGGAAEALTVSSRPINGVAFEWDVVISLPSEPVPPKCPYCGEQRMIEVDGRDGFFCNVCAKSFTLPKS